MSAGCGSPGGIKYSAAEGRVSCVMRSASGGNKGGASMDKVQRMKQEQQYEKYVKQKTPKHNVWVNMLKAFLLGGAICFLGQVIFHYCEFRKPWCLSACCLQEPASIPGWPNGAGPALWCRLPDLPTPLPLRPLSTKKKARCSESDARSLPSPARSYCMESLQAGYLD